MAYTLYVVLPCYNEQEVLPETSKRLEAKLSGLIASGRLKPDSRALFVDDGSSDSTWRVISGLHTKNPLFCGLKLSHNKGHQYALLAGLMQAKALCDVTISMDADLQDDINALDSFLDEYEKGCDIVYGVRGSRETDTPFKRGTARMFYGFMQKLGVELIPDHADYRLMSRRALEALAEYRETNLFLRGLIPQLGFKHAVVEYQREKRFAGVSKYPLKKMLALALNGIFSFSLLPVRCIALLGALIFAISLITLIICAVCGASGLTLMGCSLWTLGGLQMLALGVAGEYVGKAYEETKRRPRYIVEEFLGDV